MRNNTRGNPMGKAQQIDLFTKQPTANKLKVSRDVVRKEDETRGFEKLHGVYRKSTVALLVPKKRRAVVANVGYCGFSVYALGSESQNLRCYFWPDEGKTWKR